MTDIIVLNNETRNLYKSLIPEHFWSLLVEREDFFAFGAIFDDTACGYMIVERDDGGYIIQDIFVHPDYRRKGIATNLIRVLVDTAYKYLEDIDCHFIIGKDDSFKQFLDSTGLFAYEEENDTKIYYGPTALLYESEPLKPFMSLNPKKEQCLDFYDECPPSLRKKFIKDCMENNLLPVYSIPETRPEETKYCYVATSPDNSEIQAYVKMNTSEDTVYLASVWSKKAGQKKLMLLLASVVAKIRADGGYKYMEACVVDKEVEGLLNRMIPNLEIKAVGYSAYWNYKKYDEV